MNVFFLKNILGSRVTEKNLIQKVQYSHALSTSIASLTAVFATVFTILGYTLFGYDITPAEVSFG